MRAHKKRPPSNSLAVPKCLHSCILSSGAGLPHSLLKTQAFTFDFTRIDGREDLATARGDYSITAEIEGQEVTMNGKFIDTFRKSESGEWFYDEVIWSNNEPMA